MEISFTTWQNDKAARMKFEDLASLKNSGLNTNLPAWDIIFNGRKLKFQMWIEELIQYCERNNIK